MKEHADFLELARQNWRRADGDDMQIAAWTIAAALISIAESHQRVADALEKIQVFKEAEIIEQGGATYGAPSLEDDV